LLLPDWREQVDRAEKKELVTTLHDVFSNTGVVVVAHYSGLSVADMTDLRSRMREAGGRVKVAKNRLAKLALEGTEVAHIGDLLKGPTVIAYSDDPVTAPKVAVDFAKAHQNLVILGGAMGETALDPDGVKSLATMPSLDELRAKIIGMLNTPATRVAQVLAAPGGQIARVLSAYAEQDKAA
jgi:large subunit ribosomal protein L10